MRRLILETIDEAHRSPCKPLLLAAAVTKPKKSAAGGRRKGAKAPQKIEKLLYKEHIREPEEATAFRALSARGNYLAADRPHIGLSAKELCREFAKANQTSFLKLKRLARYLHTHKRLVY